MLLVPVPGGDRSSGAGGARLCVLDGWGSRSQRSRWRFLAKIPPPSSSKPLRRRCRVFSLPVPSPSPPASLAHRPLPSVLPWLWLARCTRPSRCSCTPKSTPGSSGPKAWRARALFPSPRAARRRSGKSWRQPAGRAPTPALQAQQPVPAFWGCRLRRSRERDSSPGWAAPTGPQPPSISQRWHQIWEDRRGSRVTWRSEPVHAAAGSGGRPAATERCKATVLPGCSS